MPKTKEAGKEVEMKIVAIIKNAAVLTILTEP